MKICLVAEANSAHIEKWCGYFLSRGHEVHVISFTQGDIPGTVVHWIDLGLEGEESDLAKLKYLTKGRKIRKIIREIAPDVVSVHYATSYGASVALSGFRGYSLSVWGADIYDFPRKSALHRALARYSLSKADVLFSTSRAMAKEARKYNKDKKIEITPFGVDTELFSPAARTRAEDGIFRIGLVKKLDPKYGIDVLLQAAAKIRTDRPEINLQLVIAGTGPAEQEYHALAEKLGLSDRVVWTGFIPQAEAARVWADSDLAVIPSTLDSESFGVAAVEAESCGIPVIISDIPGLMEATRPDHTSLVVRRKDPEALAEAILRMYDDPSLRRRMGENGRKYVLNRYEYHRCFRHIEELLEQQRERGKRRSD